MNNAAVDSLGDLAPNHGAKVPAFARARGNLTSGRLLARNALWNVSGYMLPLVVAVPATPILIHSLGTNRFGVLALAWVVIGYLTFFDLGFGRALTQLLAQKLVGEDERLLASFVWTALILMLAIGLVVMALAMFLAPGLVHGVLKVPAELQSETLGAFYLLALSVPVIVTSIGLRSVLEAKQRFFLINAVRLPMGVFMFIGPLLALPFSHNMRVIVAALLAGRLVAWLAHLVLSFHVMPALITGFSFRRAAVLPLVRFGSWTTVTNVVSPLMVYMDRFLIGALVSVAGIAYYATPYEVVTKLSLVAGALAGVLFPAFATSFINDRGRARVLFALGVKFVFLALLPLTLLIVALAREGIGSWLGPEFAIHSTRVLQLLAIGVFLNALAQLPFTLIQGVGRPDLTAKLHLMELPLYATGLWWAVSAWGIIGAAFAWTGRVAIDALVLFVLAQRLVPVNRLPSRVIALGTVYALIALAAFQLTSTPAKLVSVFLALAAYFPVVWFFVLSAEERLGIRGLLVSPAVVVGRTGRRGTS